MEQQTIEFKQEVRWLQLEHDKYFREGKILTNEQASNNCEAHFMDIC
jgi:hypothetical protein